MEKVNDLYRQFMCQAVERFQAAFDLYRVNAISFNDFFHVYQSFNYDLKYYSSKLNVL